MRRSIISTICASCLLIAQAALRPAQTNAQDQSDPGVEVQTRGPVHEAFASPADPQPTATPIVPKQPPDPITELPPDQKPEGDNVQWMPGYWAWDDERSDFLWISGFWRAPPPGRQWVPGNWIAISGGWQRSPGFWQSVQQTEVQYLPPPPPLIESSVSVPAPTETSVLVPGIWVYRTGRYAWRPAYWIEYHANWVWIPAHYVWTPLGCVFVEGHWDYPLASRGILFAPVIIERPLLVRAGWRFTPRFVVSTDFLFGALFVRPSYGQYYFGDYYEPSYARLGFTAWIDFRIGGRSYDPLYSYYRRYHHNDVRWERDLHTLYVARQTREVPRPPRTLVQQNQVINNITITNNVTNVKNVTVVAPITKVDPKVVKLETISRDQRERQMAQAQQLREVSKQRVEHESATIKQTGPIRTPEAAHAVKFDLPKPPAAAVQSRTPPPPPPTAATHVEPSKPPVVTPKKEMPVSTPMPPPKRDVTPPPPMPKKDSPPPPMPKKDSPPPPPPPKKDVTPPPMPKKEPPPPPPPKKEPPPPPKKENPPPKKDKDKG